jgi:hypothetical protein
LLANLLPEKSEAGGKFVAKPDEPTERAAGGLYFPLFEDIFLI